jgi:hypothetical protein
MQVIDMCERATETAAFAAKSRVGGQDGEDPLTGVGRGILRLLGDGDKHPVMLGRIPFRLVVCEGQAEFGELAFQFLEGVVEGRVDA